jgi:hypothetical protein
LHLGNTPLAGLKTGNPPGVEPGYGRM